eukprot:6937335-Prymnesium_polylepis.1
MGESDDELDDDDDDDDDDDGGGVSLGGARMGKAGSLAARDAARAQEGGKKRKRSRGKAGGAYNKGASYPSKGKLSKREQPVKRRKFKT